MQYIPLKPPLPPRPSLFPPPSLECRGPLSPRRRRPSTTMMPAPATRSQSDLLAGGLSVRAEPHVTDSLFCRCGIRGYFSTVVFLSRPENRSLKLSWNPADQLAAFLMSFAPAPFQQGGWVHPPCCPVATPSLYPRFLHHRRCGITTRTTPPSADCLPASGTPVPASFLCSFMIDHTPGGGLGTVAAR